MSWIGRPDTPRERLWLWRFGFRPVRRIWTAFLPLRVEGRENVPAAGPYIIVANHISWLDPPVIEFALGVPVRYMAKREVFEVPLIGFVLRALGNFPVRRGESDRRALETALGVLAAGQPLGFFPEGTRSKDASLRRAKPGIAFLARRSGAPILPVAVMGTPDIRLRIPPRADALVRIGRLVPLPELGSPAADDQELADAIMRRVAVLLPEQMRGAYTATT